jgi:hypothetical protein
VPLSETAYVLSGRRTALTLNRVAIARRWIGPTPLTEALRCHRPGTDYVPWTAAEPSTESALLGSSSNRVARYRFKSCCPDYVQWHRIHVPLVWSSVLEEE